MATVSLEAARKAKPKASQAARLCAVVVGVGLTRIEGSYAVKVNLREAAPPGAALPASIDGVPVVYEVVGPIARHRG